LSRCGVEDLRHQRDRADVGAEAAQLALRRRARPVYEENGETGRTSTRSTSSDSVFGAVFSFFAALFTFLMGFLAFFDSLRFLAIAVSCLLRQTPRRFTFRFIDHLSSCDAIAESKSKKSAARQLRGRRRT
jgi:hypothetical protein